MFFFNTKKATAKAVLTKKSPHSPGGIFNILKQTNNILVKFIPEKSFLYRYLYFLGMKISAKVRLKPRKLLRINVHLADHCNLNCKGCDNFSSIATESFLDVNIFNRDCARISELTSGKLGSLELTGGEPLLHPHIIKCMNIARGYFKTTTISIITNGILLMKQSDEFWLNCQKNNIQICLTRYPIKLCIDKIRQSADYYGVKLGYWGGSDTPIKKMWKMPLKLSGKQDVKKSFSLCYKANECIYLCDGKLYTCSTIAYINYFNQYFNKILSVTSDDFIDLYNVKNVNEIFDFLCKPMPFCRYCNIKKATFGIDWGISKKDISEWV